MNNGSLTDDKGASFWITNQTGLRAPIKFIRCKKVIKPVSGESISLLQLSTYLHSLIFKINKSRTLLVSVPAIDIGQRNRLCPPAVVDSSSYVSNHHPLNTL